MALSSQNSNWISEEMQAAAQILAMRDQMKDLIARWNLNDMFNQLGDADITAVFPHLTKSKVSNAVNAFSAVLDALGDDVSGQATNLRKLKP